MKRSHRPLVSKSLPLHSLKPGISIPTTAQPYSAQPFQKETSTALRIGNIVILATQLIVDIPQ
jgi:hypothetical protein